MDLDFIRDAKLAVHGSTGAQLFNKQTAFAGEVTDTITNQTESKVTLTIENVSASVGDSTDLDVVLTDRNGITQRSDIGKTFIGGGQS